MMTPINITPNYFLVLSLTAVILLWGVSLRNGTVRELIRASWQGRFEDGTFLETRFTGVFILDFPLSLLVAFFFFGTNGHDRGYQLFLIDAYATLQSAFVWLYVESGREAAVKPYAVRNPIIWGMIWQAFGAAISLPLFYYYHLTWLFAHDKTGGRLTAAVSAPVAKAIPFSFVLGAVAPAIIGMIPTWIPRASLSHQRILAFWQLDPVWVSVIQGVGVMIISRWYSTPADMTNRNKSFVWVRAAYMIAAVSSATGHLYVLGHILLMGTANRGVSWARLYIPMVFTQPASSLKLVSGPWLFLQYDLIIIALSSVSWVYVLSSRLGSKRRNSTTKLVSLLLVGTTILGPGATVSLALFWREGKLQELRSSHTRDQSLGIGDVKIK